MKAILITAAILLPVALFGCFEGGPPDEKKPCADDAAADDSSDDDDAADDEDTSDDTEFDDDTTGEDVWTDSTTGLMWQVEVTDDRLHWEDAKKHCGGLSYGGYSDWLLPTISELRSLIRGCVVTETGGSCSVTDECLSEEICWNDSCNGCWVEDAPVDGCFWPLEMRGSSDKQFYWSRSLVDDRDNQWAWYVDFHVAQINWLWTYYDGGDIAFVRCVR